MKIAQLTGRSINAGDCLIEERSTALLKHCFPHAQIDMYLRKDVPNCLSTINDADAVVFTGGPLIQELAYSYPLDSYMQISKPIMLLGVGSKTSNGSVEMTYSNYSLSPQTIAFFKKVNDEGLGFGCRDIYTLRVLKRYGLQNILLTGCPAWYDLSNINNLRLSSKGIKHICVSDPWQSCYYEQAISILSFLEKKYTDAKITFVFHEQLNNDLQNKIRVKFPKINIQYIGGDGHGMHIYDSCDLHVGYRVHAHIYNLSIRNRTILIEEDGRGAGVNEILGQINLTAYKDNIKRRLRDYMPIYKKQHPIDIENHHLLEELSLCLDAYEDTDYLYLENAFKLQKRYFDNMMSFISRIRAHQERSQSSENQKYENLWGGGK